MPVEFTPDALKDLRKMPKPDREAIVEKLKHFDSTGEGDVKKLKGSGGGYRLRHGNWRAMFDIRDGVIVLRILRRRDAYR
jgi:mRNA interferase RelE/StbE